MCGIAGYVGARNPETLAAMCAALSHRGPDGDGFYEDTERGVYFAHRRLAVIDLAGGAQPMRSADNEIVVTFNGEIYNHRALRKELQSRGHRFQSDHSDTEVLIHGYREWGDGLPKRLNGQFAFAIYDRPRARLFLARDRFGEKPLFVHRRGDRVAFASELSALLLAPGVSSDIDTRSLQKFFAYGYLPGRNALFRDCFKLEAGSHLTFDLVTGETREVRYWQFEIAPQQGLTDRDEPRLIEELRALLGNAVASRMVSDVPLGLFLSGGLDSSAVLAMAAGRLDPASIKTFTIGFDEPSFDESPFAAAVASHFGTTHHVQQLPLSSARDLIEPVLRHMDEPIADASILPTSQLAAFTRQRVTVALSGDGGDELFAGYDPFAALKSADLYGRVMPGPLHRLLRGLAGRIPRSHANMSWDFKIRRTLQGLSYPPAAWNPAWMAPLEPGRFAEFFAEPLRLEELYSEAIGVWEDGARRGLDIVDRTLEFFTRLYLTDDILVKADRASMSHSLESRAVFLDNELVDFCAKLPNRFKFRNGTRKYLLKKAMEGMLPDDIIHRKKKGFGIPLSKWLKEVPRNVPMSPVPTMNGEAIANAWRDHRSGAGEERLLLWSWLAVQWSNRGTAAPAAAAPNVGEVANAV